MNGNEMRAASFTIGLYILVLEIVTIAIIIYFNFFVF